MDRAHVLIVDDEEAIRLFLADELSQAGYVVHTAADGAGALEHVRRGDIDLILLDLRMRGMPGLRVLEEVARLPLPPAVIILTAHASLNSAIEAMRLGGCDYLLKPCRTEELLASVEKGLARRREDVRKQQVLSLLVEAARQLQAPAGEQPRPPAREPSSYQEVRDLRLDLSAQEAFLAGRPLSLTATEFRLLARLIQQAGQIVSYRDLASELHGYVGEMWDARQAISTHMWRLGRKLGADSTGRPYVVNVRGRGYKFVTT